MVLIVEDDESARDTFARALRLAGHQVRVARDGFQALEILAQETPALIFADLHMPKVDGWVLRAAQRKSSRLVNIPFVVISADVDVEEHGRLLDATAILAKPVDLDDIVRCAERYDH